MLKNYIRTARPEHYVKNLFVFAAIIFSGELFNLSLLLDASISFVSFCFVSSAVYYFNDIFDKGYDHEHPEKSQRPIAAGAISIPNAWVVSILLLMIALLLAWWVNMGVVLIVFIYWLLNLIYSYRLKDVVLLDILIIAAGFILRILAGGKAVSVPVSDWLLLCVGLLALFLALAKRRGELVRFQPSDEKATRKVLRWYSLQLLDQLIVLTATLSIITYSLYCILNENYQHLLYTTPFVIYGLFRYLFIIYHHNRGTRPEKEMLHDRHIMLTVLFWGISAIVIIKYFQS